MGRSVFFFLIGLAVFVLFCLVYVFNDVLDPAFLLIPTTISSFCWVIAYKLKG